MAIGIDIGSKTVKIIELTKNGQSWELRGSGIIGYKGATPDKAVEERELISLADVIRKLHKEANISSKDVNISLPEQSVFTRTIKFPLLTDQEIDAAIKWEAEQYIPIPVSEAIIQHQILERRENSTPPEVVVLLVAAPRNLVENYVKVVSLAGLNVVGVETELVALTRALAPAGKTVLLVDFGAGSTDIAIAKNRNLMFSRSIPTAGEAFTRAVAQTLGVEYQQAEQYKKAYGLSTTQLEGRIKGAIDPVFKMVTDEIKKAVQYYLSEEKGEAPTSVVLSGGTSGMPDALSLLTKMLGYEVLIANPFSYVAVSPEVAKSILPFAPLYSIAVGLALEGE